MKSGMDSLREDRKDIRTISNATAGSVTLTQKNFDTDCTNGLGYDFDGAGLTTVTLPVAKVGYRIKAMITGAGGVKFVPGTGDKLSTLAGTQAANKYITSTTVGGSITLECIRLGVWDCKSQIGTWTVES